MVRLPSTAVLELCYMHMYTYTHVYIYRTKGNRYGIVSELSWRLKPAFTYVQARHVVCTACSLVKKTEHSNIDDWKREDGKKRGGMETWWWRRSERYAVEEITCHTQIMCLRSTIRRATISVTDAVTSRHTRHVTIRETLVSKARHEQDETLHSHVTCRWNVILDATRSVKRLRARYM